MKVYIICPYNVTGGPKSLHQLGSNLVNKGLQVFMFYGEKVYLAEKRNYYLRIVKLMLLQKLKIVKKIY